MITIQKFSVEWYPKAKCAPDPECDCCHKPLEEFPVAVCRGSVFCSDCAEYELGIKKGDGIYVEIPEPEYGWNNPTTEIQELLAAVYEKQKLLPYFRDDIEGVTPNGVKLKDIVDAATLAFEALDLLNGKHSELSEDTPLYFMAMDGLANRAEKFLKRILANRPEPSNMVIVPGKRKADATETGEQL